MTKNEIPDDKYILPAGRRECFVCYGETANCEVFEVDLFSVLLVCEECNIQGEYDFRESSCFKSLFR